MVGERFLNPKEAEELTSTLSKSYKDAKYYLHFKTPIDLVVAAILSAQTRDEVVNAATPKLFSKYKTAKDYAHADPQELVEHIKSISFAGNKARNIINTCRTIDEKYGGKVPDKMEQLVELPGIGRKTANTILINAYGIVEGIPVDTWVIKLSYRLGLSKNTDPEKIEQDLMKVVDKKYWHNYAYVMKAHGKKICQTIPICSKCPVNDICPKNGVTKKL
ncbi:MAG: endonuclease III [Candidatus Micrarchaeales archaeon]|nr:endonuclease III [Candidatus Micrarchaeales archaeon]